AQDVRVRGQLAARRRPDLVQRAGEVARRREHVRRRLALPPSVLAVAARAPPVVDRLAGMPLPLPSPCPLTPGRGGGAGEGAGGGEDRNGRDPRSRCAPPRTRRCATVSADDALRLPRPRPRSEEHTSELQ